MHVLQPGVAWDGRDLFLSFFNLTAVVRYNIFVDRLMKHSFLMKTAEERMRSFFKIVHAKELNQLPNLNEFSIILTTETFERYLSWDAVDMGENLKSVYEYEDENVKKRHYDGQDVMHLLEFLRNAYRHPRRNSITKLDKDVRKAYPGFLNRLHEALCRYIFFSLIFRFLIVLANWNIGCDNHFIH